MKVYVHFFVHHERNSLSSDRS